MINKKGNIMAILLVVGALFLLVMVGVMLVIGSTTINYVMDTVMPEIDTLGQVGDVNTTQVVDITIDPVDTFIQNFTWVAGLIYIFGLVGVFGLAFAFKSTGDKWLIGLFFALTLILVIGCIFMSNIYEDIHGGTDDFASIIQEHVMLSFLIIYSPAIMSIIAFVAGIILFSGGGNEGI